MIYNKNEKRLVIYFFYDKDGIVDRYVDYMLADVVANTNELIVVCNGLLSEDGRKIFEKHTDNIIVRENIGFDVWAYKTALESVGYENLASYSEVIMMNFTIMGPLYPFSEMFEKMDKRDVDFWGMTIFHGVPYDPFGKVKYGYLPTHLQSHFIAVRTDMLKSKEFINYWKEMPMITCYEEAVGWHEAIFTKNFEDLGYKWDVYVDTRDEMDKSYCPIIMDPKDIIINKRCPIFKRRSFFHDYRDVLEYTTGEPAYELLECIKHNFDYDINLIFENILRVENQADIKRNLHLDYILPIDVDNNPRNTLEGKKIALVIHLYFEDLIDYCYSYAMSMPESSDIYITTDKVEKKKQIEEKFKQGPWNKVKVIEIENRGRDVSALLVATKTFIFDYDYVCFVHDKKVAQLNVGIKGASFSYKCFDNLLKSKNFVKNVINTFDENERLGMLMPPPPNFAEYYPTIGKVDWGENFESTVELAKKLGIKVKIQNEKEPIAPLGTMFWFRPEALRTLFEYDWDYEDFPKEPNNTDGTLLHAVERVYPYVVQSHKYYPAWLMNEKYAAIEVDNLYFMLRELNVAIFDTYGANRHIALVDQIRNMQFGNTFANQRGQLYLCVDGAYSEKNSEIINLHQGNNYFEYKDLSQYGPLNQFRWDPGERGGIEVKIPDIEIKLQSGEVIYRGIDDVIANGFRVEDKLVFLGQDPQIYFSIKEPKMVDSIVIIGYVQNNLSGETKKYIEEKVEGKSIFKKIIRRIKRRK